jgi:peptide methionine sulfoxide reductase msrA/msrB
MNLRAFLFLFLTIQTHSNLFAQVPSEIATFGGGCFWCLEPPYEGKEGIIDVVSGYMGGESSSANYQAVSSGKSGHREVVQITFNPAKISYEKLLEIFWRNIDPTDGEGQFADKGDQYKTVIYYHSVYQKNQANQSLKELETSEKFSKNFKSKIMTDILPAKKFFPAESHHQDYYKKNPERYQGYKKGSGREDFLKKAWGAY